MMDFFFQRNCGEGNFWGQKQVVEKQQLPQRFVTLKEESKIIILTLAYFEVTRNPSLDQWFANGPSPDTVSSKTFAVQQSHLNLVTFTNI